MSFDVLHMAQKYTRMSCYMYQQSVNPAVLVELGQPAPMSRGDIYYFLCPHGDRVAFVLMSSSMLRAKDTVVFHTSDISPICTAWSSFRTNRLLICTRYYLLRILVHVAAWEPYNPHGLGQVPGLDLYYSKYCMQILHNLSTSHTTAGSDRIEII